MVQVQVVCCQLSQTFELKTSLGVRFEVIPHLPPAIKYLKSFTKWHQMLEGPPSSQLRILEACLLPAEQELQDLLVTQSLVRLPAVGQQLPHEDCDGPEVVLLCHSNVLWQSPEMGKISN